MKRKLNKAEEEFIVNHYNDEGMTPEQLCVDMEGIGESTVKAFLKKYLKEATAITADSQNKEDKGGKFKVGKLLARNSAGGAVIMTQGASELSDARRAITVPSPDQSAKSKPTMIHIMDKDRKTR